MFVKSLVEHFVRKKKKEGIKNGEDMIKELLKLEAIWEVQMQIAALSNFLASFFLSHRPFCCLQF